MEQPTPRGRFVWYELVTTDPTAAQTFYTDVAGWGTAPFDAAPMPYTMWLRGETPVGGVMELPAEAREGGVPPHWLGYVAVDDVDATTARAKERGARIIMAPDTIPDVGRMVIFADPQGAVLGAHTSAQAMSAEDPETELGDVSWRELATSDHEAAFDFYSDLFGWEKDQAMDMGEAGVYQMYGRAGHMLGGMYNKSAGMPDPSKRTEEPGPSAWLYYIRVGDLDTAVKKVRAKGGTIVVEPREVPGGSRIAVGIDPQGAAFGMHQTA